MKRIKTELLMIGKERGDGGTTEDQVIWIENFIQALERYLTPEGVLTFSAEQLRLPYVEYIKTVIITCDESLAAESLPLFFHTRSYQRDVEPVIITGSGSVVDIFKKRS